MRIMTSEPPVELHCYNCNRRTKHAHILLDEGRTLNCDGCGKDVS